MHRNVSFTPLFITLCYASFRGPCKKQSRIKHMAQPCVNPSKHKETSETCSLLGHQLDPTGVFGTEMRAPCPTASCFALVLPLRVHCPSGGWRSELHFLPLIYRAAQSNINSEPLYLPTIHLTSGTCALRSICEQRLSTSTCPPSILQSQLFIRWTSLPCPSIPAHRDTLY